jgi:UDP-N-acetylglucosamine acyltransferase
MPTIHPTAIIEGDVSLADDVVVGPWCHLSGVLGPLRVGAGTRLRSRVTLEGPLDLGSGNDLYPNVSIGGAPQDLGFHPDTPGAGLIIGNKNCFREGVSIHRPKTALPGRIGDSNYWMANSHAGHDCIVGNHCIFSNGVLLAGHVEVADRVIMGGSAAVHQFARVGRGAMISGLSGVVQDLCPFFLVTEINVAWSVNVVGLRRQGATSATIDTVRWVHQTICRSGLLLKNAVEVLRSRAGDPLVDEYLAFIAASKRGVATARGRGSTRGD